MLKAPSGNNSKSTKSVYSDGNYRGKLSGVVEDKDGSGALMLVFSFTVTDPGNIRDGEPLTFLERCSMVEENGIANIQHIAAVAAWNGSIGQDFDGKDCKPLFLSIQYRPARETFPESNALKAIYPAEASTEAKSTLAEILSKGSKAADGGGDAKSRAKELIDKATRGSKAADGGGDAKSRAKSSKDEDGGNGG